MARLRCVLDSGAVSALAEGQNEARKALKAAIRTGREVVVPAVVVAETTRGTARDAPVNRVLASVTIVDCDEGMARAAGALLHPLRSSATIDAIVVSTADSVPGSIVLTGDREDILRLASIRAVTRVLRI